MSPALRPLIVLLAAAAVLPVRAQEAGASPQAAGADSGWSSTIGGIAGAALPVGEFADARGGAASPGFLVGLEFNLRHPAGLGWLTTVAAAVNGVDSLAAAYAYPGAALSVGSWATIWVLTGVRYDREVAQSLALYGSGQIGLLYGMSPELNAGYGIGRDHVDSQSRAAFAFGLGGGVIIGSTITLRIAFVRGVPAYRLPLGGTASEGDSQPTSLVWLAAGLAW